MTDRPASWRMPTPTQIEKMADAVGRKPSPARRPASDEDLPPACWQALLDDSHAGASSPGPGPAGVRTPLSQILQHILRVGCRRCARTVEIQKADATQLYGPDAIWKDVGRRLLDNTCTQRTERHEEDGCRPVFE
jgi:hypothetical protein